MRTAPSSPSEGQAVRLACDQLQGSFQPLQGNYFEASFTL